MLCKAITSTVYLSSLFMPSFVSSFLETSSSYIRINAFIAWCKANSCLSIYDKMAQILRWISQGLDIFKLSSTGSFDMLMHEYSRSNACSKYYSAFLSLLVFLNKQA